MTASHEYPDSNRILIFASTHRPTDFAPTAAQKSPGGYTTTTTSTTTQTTCRLPSPSLRSFPMTTMTDLTKCIERRDEAYRLRNNAVDEARLAEQYARDILGRLPAPTLVDLLKSSQVWNMVERLTSYQPPSSGDVFDLADDLGQDLARVSKRAPKTE